jgi:hypothetical protein
MGSDRRIRQVFALASVLVAGGVLAAAPAELERPDVLRWITLGVTVRTDPTTQVTPNQLRQVRLEPKAFDALMSTGAYPDGAQLAATFHTVQLDKAHTPALYAAQDEKAVAIEIIDRSVPDGRVFYLFTGNAKTARAMPQGNECAACHNAQGTLDGTFAHLYPATAKLAKK